jgi:hypothetical protein
MRRVELVVICLLIVGSVVWVHFADKLAAPFVIFALLGLSWAAFVYRLAGTRAGRVAAFLVGILFICMAETETFFYFAAKPWTLQYTISAAWQQRDRNSGLGDVTVPGAIAEQKASHDGRVLYDAIYTIDPDGLRHIPAEIQGGPFTVAFVGCSYMFGHGLNDDQTLPYFFLKDAHGTFRGFNFAVDDWGPHEILREIELGKMATVVKRPNLVVYEALSDHLVRTSGRNAFDPFGARYVLCGDNSLCYEGPFHSRSYELLLNWLFRSWTFWYIQWHYLRRVRNADLPLYVAIVARIRDSVERDGSKFVVLFWDSWPQDDAIIRALQVRGIDVIRVTGFIPDLRTNQVKYLISPFDPHPSAMTNQMLADHLLQHVRKDVSGSGEAVNGKRSH